MPAVVPSTWFMSVTRARVGRPAPQAMSTRARASRLDACGAGAKAPLPVLTSMTRPSRPAASFLDRIEAVIIGSMSTVAVTSRMA